MENLLFQKMSSQNFYGYSPFKFYLIIKYMQTKVKGEIASPLKISFGLLIKLLILKSFSAV